LRSYQIVNLPSGSFKIDTEDFHVLVGMRWEINRGYVKQAWKRGSPRGDKNALARLILKAPKNLFVDHINGDPLDNRRFNLRLATPSENMMNKRKAKKEKSTSIYKGVDFHKGKWRVRIKKNKVVIYDLRADTETEAALLYNKLALEVHGEFARLNKIT